MNLKHLRYANKSLNSSFGTLEFDENGVLKTKLEEDALEALAQIKGFVKVEGEAKHTKAAKKEEKEPVKEEQDSVEEKEEKEHTGKKSSAAKTHKKTAK